MDLYALVGRRLQNSKEGTAAETVPVVEAAPKGIRIQPPLFLDFGT
jgi:hypothetical protein